MGIGHLVCGKLRGHTKGRGFVTPVETRALGISSLTFTFALAQGRKDYDPPVSYLCLSYH